MTIELFGVSNIASDGTVSEYVSPCYVASNDSLSSVNDATNAVEISSDNLDRTTYIGQGAGRFPTVNSCVNGIASLAKGDKTVSPFNPPSDVSDVPKFDSVFYLRLKYSDYLVSRLNSNMIPHLVY